MLHKCQKITLSLPRPEEKLDIFNTFRKLGWRAWQSIWKRKSESCSHSDNCAAHPVIGGLKTIDLFFVPPYTTSVLQPMDQGAICSLKA